MIGLPSSLTENVEIFQINENILNISFCHVPKAASSTWLKIFATLSNITVTNFDVHTKISEKYGIGIQKFIEDYANYKSIKITCIRHPFERLVT